MRLQPPPGRGWRLAPEPPLVAGALLLTGLVLALGFLVLAVYDERYHPRPEEVDPYVSPFHGPAQINAWVLRIAPLFDSRGQRLAHLAVVAAVAAIVLFAPTLRSRDRGRVVVTHVVPVATALGLGLAAVKAGIPRLHLIAGLVFVVVLTLAAPVLKRTWANRGAAALCTILLAAAVLPGFFLRLDLSRAGPDAPWVQWHYSIVLGPGDLLAAGWRIFEDVRPAYGVILPVLAAGYQRHIGPLEMGDYVRVLQALQLLLLAACAWLCLRHARQRWPFVFFGLAFVLPWFHSTQPGLLFPNQTPWRMIAVPLAACGVVALARRRASSAALPLGFVGGGSLALNLECGITVGAGLLAALFFWRDRGERRGRLILGLALGGLGAALLTAVLCRLSLGRWPTGRGWSAMAETVGFVTATSYSGSPLVLDPLALLMFGHAVFVLVLTACVGRRGTGPASRAFVAATLVVWFAYYANRPHRWNLSGFHVLYVLLLLDLGRCLSASLARRRASANALLASTVLATIVVPSTLSSYAWSLRPLQKGEFSPPAAAGAVLLNGVRMAPAFSAELRERSGSLRESSPGRVLYLTGDSYLQPKVSGVYPPLPFLDPVFAALTRPAYEDLLERVRALGPERLYFEPAGSFSYALSPFRGFFEMLRMDLAVDYHRSGVRGGWEVWERIPTTGALLRRRTPPEASPALRVLAAGGRTTEGRGTPPGRSWTDRLSSLLACRWPGAWVDNLGLDGQSTAGLLKLLSRGAAALQPTFALFLVGAEDMIFVTAEFEEGPLDLRRRAHLTYGPRGRRRERVREWCRDVVLPAYRGRLTELIRTWREAGVEPVLLTQPALFGAQTDPATGVDLATVVVNADARINGALAWELLELVNGVTRDVGQETETAVVDLANELPKDSRLFLDFLRFSDAGAEEVARRVDAGLGPQLLARAKRRP